MMSADFASRIACLYAAARVRRARHQSREIQGAGDRGRAGLLGNEQHVLQPGHAFAPWRDLALEERIRRDQHGCPAQIDARGDRLRPERGEQRRDDRAVLQAAEQRDVQLGDASGDDEEPVALADPQAAQHVAEAVAQRGELAVADGAGRRAAREKAQCGLVPAGARAMAIDGLPCDIQPAARLDGEFPRDGRPREPAPFVVVIEKIRRDPQVDGCFGDYRGRVHSGMIQSTSRCSL